MTRCKSCNAVVIWCVTTTGKSMPVDQRQSPHGNLVLEYQPATGDTLARYVPPGEGTHTSHFATCPQAAEHRRRQGSLKGIE